MVVERQPHISEYSSPVRNQVTQMHLDSTETTQLSCLDHPVLPPGLGQVDFGSPMGTHRGTSRTDVLVAQRDNDSIIMDQCSTLLPSKGTQESLEQEWSSSATGSASRCGHSPEFSDDSSDESFDDSSEDSSEESGNSKLYLEDSSHMCVDSDSRDSTSTSNHTRIIETNPPHHTGGALLGSEINLGEGNVKARTTFTNDDQAYIRILHFLDEELRAPRNAFDKLMDFLQDISASGFDFCKVHPSRKSFMKKLETEFQCTKPEVIKVELECDDRIPESKRFVHVIRFDAESQIRDLLHHPVWRHPECLVVNPENPFGMYIPRSGRLGEVLSGSWYKRTYSESIKTPLLQFLLVLILYQDKTGISAVQRHGLEPVMFTFANFKEEFRNQCESSWRHLGFIPDYKQMYSQDELKTNQSSKGRNARNHHKIQRVILEPLVQLQKGLFQAFITIGNMARYMHVLTPVAFIIGDTLSQDTLCGRVPTYTKKVRRSHRACYCRYYDLADPHHKCQWVRQKEQHDLLKNCEDSGAEDDIVLRGRLQEVSTNRSYSSLFDVWFGVSVFGFFLACVTDLMHVFRQGTIPKCIFAFFERLSSNQKKELEKLAEECIHGTRSSQRSRFPRVSFSGGFTKMKFLSAGEWMGALTMYLILSSMYRGQAIMRFDDDDQKFAAKWERKASKQKTSQKRRKLLIESGMSTFGDRMAEEEHMLGNEGESDADNQNLENNTPRCTTTRFRQLLEMCLCFDAYTRQKELWKVGHKAAANTFQRAVRRMMSQVLKTLDRSSGNGWNFPKFHELLHPKRQIMEYGRPSGMDAEVGERGLKDWAKKFGRLAAQCDVNTFTISTSNLVYETSILRKAEMSIGVATDPIGLLLKVLNKENAEQNAAEEANNDKGGVGKLLFCLEWDELKENKPLIDWKSGSKYDGCAEKHCESIVEILCEQYFVKDAPQQCPQQPIMVFSELEQDGETYRAHPNYQSLGAWYEWAIVEESKPGRDIVTEYMRGKKKENQEFTNHQPTHVKKYDRPVVPARILAFFQCPHKNVPLAILHPCRPWMNMNYHMTSVLVESWNLQGKLDGTTGQVYACMDIVPVNQILEPICVFPENNDVFDDSWALHDPAGGHVVLLLNRETYWHQCFLTPLEDPVEGEEDELTDADSINGEGYVGSSEEEDSDCGENYDDGNCSTECEDN